MQQFLSWTLDTIREDESGFSWMEEYRYEWAPLAKTAVTQITEGKTVLIVTDRKREWFGKYIADKVNILSKGRPLLPVYQLGHCFPGLNDIKTTQELEVLEDMLDISYPNGYFIWYIGKGDHPNTKLAYRSDDSFLWVLDEEVPNSFTLRSADPLLDIKLLQLFNLFDLTVSGALFGDLDTEA